MKQRMFLFAALFITAFGLSRANALTLLQENLIGLPNKFAVTVSDFPADGVLTPQSLKDMASQQLEAAGFKIAPNGGTPPIAWIQVAVVRHDDPVEGKFYMLDVNVYNDSTLNTAYRLRKGTVWMMGSMKVVTGNEFPRDVEKRLGQMLRYLIQDYFAANPDAGAQ